MVSLEPSSSESQSTTQARQAPAALYVKPSATVAAQSARAMVTMPDRRVFRTDS